MAFGIIAVDKPVGITSFGCIKKLRKRLNISKIGHCGTLDSFADGLLLVLLDKATRIAQYILCQNKEYITTMKFGIKTDTQDITGNVIETNNSIPKIQDDFEKRVKEITQQIPPKFSAIKTNGERSYVLARKNIDFKMKKRKIKVLDFQILEFNFPYLVYKTTVSKGVYIRTLSQDIAELLNTVATTTKLRRTKIENISVDKAFSIETFTENNWYDLTIKIEKLLPFFETIDFNDTQAKKVVNGQRIHCDRKDGKILLFNKDVFFGIGETNNGILSPKTIIKD